jgi:hypothetical protein
MRAVFVQRLFAWVDQLPWAVLLMTALLLGLAPFSPEPHLVEKLRMLSNGELARGIDIFDLCLHGTPALLVVLKLMREGLKRGISKTT